MVVAKGPFHVAKLVAAIENNHTGIPAMAPPILSLLAEQLRSLDEIVHHTDAAIYLLDEWDANLDPSNRAMADALMQQLAHRARIVEVSHRDQE